jgi:hypothetical protein
MIQTWIETYREPLYKTIINREVELLCLKICYFDRQKKKEDADNKVW